jgi:hypothetical protein
LVAETWSAQEILQAGWNEADLAWETTAERTAEAVASEDAATAKDVAGEALQLARANFKPADPRLGTSLANYGICLILSGQRDDCTFLFREGLNVWRQSHQWIAHMDAPRIARSSLFHMRMEARHRGTYRARWQERWREIAAEATARNEALILSPGVSVTTAADALARWRRERPAMLNDTRKLMAAAFLLLAPLATGANTQ